MNIYEIETDIVTGRLSDKSTLHVLATSAEKAVRKAKQIARRQGTPDRVYDVFRLTLVGTQDK